MDSKNLLEVKNLKKYFQTPRGLPGLPPCVGISLTEREQATRCPSVRVNDARELLRDLFAIIRAKALSAASNLNSFLPLP